MSEFEDDIDDQLLALAGASEKKERHKSKSSKSRPSKKRKVDSDSDRDIESEEDEDMEDETTDPFPYEGQYLNAQDKEALLAMPEIKREEILAERSEEKRRLQEKRLLAAMVKQQKGGAGGMAAGLDDDSVARAAKRQHTARGATKEKSRKLDELKARRKAKDESRKRAKLSPKSHRDRSASPQDMDISSDESEDGIITKEQQEEDRERRLLSQGASFGSRSKEDEEDLTSATVEAFNRIRLTRDLAAKWCLAPWFQEYVTGTWVRYLIGNDKGEPVYRVCEVADLSPEPVKAYKINDRMVNQAVELKYGGSVKQFNMDRISNAKITEKEYDRLVRVCNSENIKLPTKKELHNKDAQMQKLQSQPLTEKDITAMLKRKKELQSANNPAQMKMERSRLNQARSLAFKRHDHKEVAELDEQIAVLQAQIDASGVDNVVGDSRDEALRKVNERNRKANTASMRRAELIESERKRKEREMMIEAAAKGGTAASAAVAMKHDPSARLKTVPRMFTAATTPTTRPGTPVGSTSKPGTPGAGGSGILNGGSGAPGVIGRPSPSVNSTIAFEQKLLDTIEIDLGDF